MNKPAESKPIEEVSVTVKLPKPLHAKLTQIAVSEGKSLTAKVAQAVREHAATYERTSKTVTAYTRKKGTNDDRGETQTGNRRKVVGW